MSTNMHKNDAKKVMQGCAGLCEGARAGGGSVPTINQSNSPTVMGIGTLHIVPWGHGGGYVYIYIYVYVYIYTYIYIYMYIYIYIFIDK